MNILKLTLDEKKFLNVFHEDLYKIDNQYDLNIDMYLDSFFYSLVDAYDIKFVETVFH
jgi:hypothetical protein